MTELGMDISNNDSCFMGISSRMIRTKFYKIYMFDLLILAFENLGPLTVLRSLFQSLFVLEIVL